MSREKLGDRAILDDRLAPGQRDTQSQANDALLCAAIPTGQEEIDFIAVRQDLRPWDNGSGISLSLPGTTEEHVSRLCVCYTIDGTDKLLVYDEFKGINMPVQRDPSIMEAVTFFRVVIECMPESRFVGTLLALTLEQLHREIEARSAVRARLHAQEMDLRQLQSTILRLHPDNRNTGC